MKADCRPAVPVDKPLLRGLLRDHADLMPEQRIGTGGCVPCAVVPVCWCSAIGVRPMTLGVIEPQVGFQLELASARNPTHLGLDPVKPSPR